jgi:phosphopantothenoylcysteine decarboxylase / phosphopantothenate---cysteine ligase
MREELFKGKKIIVGVTGCIAAYKSAYLIRELKQLGAEVKVVMTPSAAEFIAPLTLASLSHNEVIMNIFPDQKSGSKLTTWHIDYALWADLMILAPCTVNTAAKIAYGFADNALLTLVLALRSPLLIAPAADVDMYENKISQQNFKKLEERGFFIVSAEEGELASGLTGFGRMADVGKIVDAAEIIFSGYKKDLTGKKILISAGPTYEDIDPVRYIGNRSSGKMGFAIAKAAYLRGADVTVISGPSSEVLYPEIKKIKVRSAEEMFDEIEKNLSSNDILIMSAAAADFKPKEKAAKKIKKSEKLDTIELENTVDILSSIKKDGKKIVGFALESDNEITNAKEKLKKKNLDIIVLNSIADEGSGFEFDTNKISIINKEGNIEEFPLQTKFQAANKILDAVKEVKE